MTKPPYLEEDCVKGYKLKAHTHKAKNLSFFASIFSLFIYICVFYVFNLSPYTLLNNNIFWFFMSNTLILIIAADYEAFSSSSKQKQDLYEEYVKNSHAIRNHVSPPHVNVPVYDEQVDKQCNINPKQELLREKKEIISDHQNSDHHQIVPERVLEIVVENQPNKPSYGCTNDEKNPILDNLQGDDGNKKEYAEKATFQAARIYGRSKSHRYNRAKHVVTKERTNSMRRLETVKIEPKVEEENEFSTMTNEDLNRRVEEFIQKFNRQIRLQATRNVY